MTENVSTLLDELDALEAKATAGEWRIVKGMAFLLESSGDWTVGDFERGDPDSPISEEEAEANAAFVSKFRNAYPAMSKALRSLREFGE